MRKIEIYLSGLSPRKKLLVIFINVMVLLAAASFGPDSTVAAIMDRAIFQRILFVLIEVFFILEIAVLIIIARSSTIVEHQ